VGVGRVTDRAPRPLDYATLSAGERAAVETLYYTEFSVCDRAMLVCSAR